MGYSKNKKGQQVRTHALEDSAILKLWPECLEVTSRRDTPAKTIMESTFKGGRR